MEYKRYKNRMEKFLSSNAGRQFFHVAYSVGAAVVLLGVLFKLNHYSFGSTVLFIGIGAEVLIFLLSAFDRPVKEYRWEDVFPALQTNGNGKPNGNAFHETEKISVSIPYSSVATETSEPHSQQLGETIDSLQHSSKSISENTEGYARQMEALNRNIAGLNAMYEMQLRSIGGQMNTIDQIGNALKRIRTAYDDAAPDNDAFRRETERMATQLRELNEVYARMLRAMTVNNNNNNPQS